SGLGKVRCRMGMGWRAKCGLGLLAFSIPFSASGQTAPYLTITKVDQLRALLSGDGILIGQVESKLPEDTHSAFGNDLAYLRPGGPVTAQAQKDHATNVAGIMIAGSKTVTGVTYFGVTRRARIASAWWEETIDGDDALRSATDWQINVDPSVDVINISAGYDANAVPNTNVGGRNRPGYAMIAADRAASEQNRLVIAAAGNAGLGGNPAIGANSIDSPACGFNVLAVGATGQMVDGAMDYNRYATYSSNGFTYDNRDKPDLVAPGTSFVLPTSVDVDLNGSFDDWRNAGSGTSFAAPMVTGVAALLLQHGNDRNWNHFNDTQVLRAVLMNSASKAATGSDGRRWMAREADRPRSQPLDRQLGAGRLDAMEAYDNYRAGESDPTPDDGPYDPVGAYGWDADTISGTGLGNSNDYLLPRLLRGSYIIATLCWERHTTSNFLGGGYKYAAELDDLDLAVSPKGNFDNRLEISNSIVDSTEHLVWRTLAADGAQNNQYWIRAYISSATTGNNEEYGIAWRAVEAPRTILAYNGNFRGDTNGILDDGWYQTPGTAPVATVALASFMDPGSEDSYAMKLESTSNQPVGMSQEVFRPTDALVVSFDLAFDSFGSPDDSLKLMLGSIDLLSSIGLPNGLAPQDIDVGAYYRFEFPFTDPGIFALLTDDYVELSFVFTSESGNTAYIDNVSFVPEPVPVTAMIAAIATVLSRRRLH
ncbi:MAG: S8 family serine peptidase, partial [Tepidisphaeraceae bacterium]